MPPKYSDSSALVLTLQRTLAAALGPLLALMLSGCASETLFQSSFNSNAVGSPPAHAQAVGTIDVSGAPGSVRVVGPPPGATEKWAQIRRTGDQAPISTMLCNFDPIRGEGTYTLLAAMFIPSGSGLATITFETSTHSSPPTAEFLHLDFLTDNRIRINDDAGQVFGAFPRDRLFSIAVTLEISSSTAVAHIQLFGTGTSGSRDVTVTPLSLARQIGAVRFWMGFPWQGFFDATDILVTRRTD